MGVNLKNLPGYLKRVAIDAPLYLARYRKTIPYIMRTRGIRAVLNFIFVKLFMRGERSGLALLDPLWRLAPALAPYPWDIEIEVTTKCNLRCTICEHTYWKKDPYMGRDLSLEDFKKIIAQFPKLKWINLTGEGLAFLNKEFLDIVRYAKQRNIFVAIVDCFTQLDEKVGRELIKAGVEKLWVSIDGASKETYEAIRVGANFDQVVENIRTFVHLKREMKSPIPEFGFRYVFFKHNYHEMLDFLDLVHSFGDINMDGDGNLVEFVALLEFNETKDWVYEPSPELIEEIERRARELNINVVWTHPSHNPELKTPMGKCTDWTEPYIMMGGYVVSCCAVLMSNQRPFLRKHSFGNIHEQSFQEIWNSPRYKQFRKLVPQDQGEVPILCRGCRAYDTTNREKHYGLSSTI
jgi:MoaA/NifB/PqqE/SkfB family radical SAM enzyme